MSGILWVVATPIGNLQDVTTRALDTLKSADLIVCEDTRVTAKLLAVYGISKSLVALHEHSSPRRIARVIEDVRAGKRVAYVTDAGTPGVNDPGGKLVARAFESDVRVEPIPGPSALTAAISVSGFPMESFTYLGFAPRKKGRQTFFREIAERKTASIFFESTHRISKTLAALAETLPPSRRVFVGRELTKLHETLYRGTAEEVRDQVEATSMKGEFVLIVGPIY